MMDAAASAGDAHLVAEGVTVSLSDQRRIVNSVDLAVSPGERLAIVGPNGAGKTTLLRLLSGQAKPDVGRILLHGRDLARMSLRDRARSIAVVGQSDSPDLRLTVEGYVGLGRIPHLGRVDAQAHRRVVADALRVVGLDAMSRRRLATLSGGERQRTAIARALAQEPAVLLLDEPTNHLDLRARADVLDVVSGLGMTTVAVLHDLALLTPFADRVAVMRNGRLVSHGPPSVALTPAIVRDVFDLDCFAVTNPASGRALLVFDVPQRPSVSVPTSWSKL